MSTSIIDNRNDNALLSSLKSMAHSGQEISIVTIFFSPVADGAFPGHTETNSWNT